MIKNNIFVLCVSIILLSCENNTGKQYAGWEVTGGTKESIRYSSLSQIDTTNVSGLKVAWTYSTNDADTVNHSQMQCNPIIVNGVLYGTSPMLKLFAVDAASGKEKWSFYPQAIDSATMKIGKRFNLNNNRGVTYWKESDDERIFYTVGGFLFSVDAKTGRVVETFGNHGIVDMHEGLGRDATNLYVASTSPGIIYKNLLIMGSRVSESSDAAPGHIRAYDVRTGKQQWIFHTIPHPGEYGFDSWEDTTAYKHIGGANAWSGFSLDEKRGLLFASTGSASFDFYGGMRKGANLFANSILAIEASTGKYKWHYQTLHHDVWDKDLPTPPALVTVEREGKKIDAIAQPTKHGFVFVLDRETGAPLFPIEEVAVQTETDIKGEKLFPTQPIPSLPKPFTRQTFTANDLNDLIPDSSYQDLKKRFEGHKSGNMFIPPSLAGTIFFPGLDGGAEWGGPAFDPESGLLYVNSNEVPWVIRLVPVNIEAPKKESFLEAGQRLYQESCVACHGVNREGAGNYPSLKSINKKYDEKAFKELVASGRRMMPGFKMLSAEEADAIAAFVLEQKTEQKRKFESARVAIDSFRQLPYTVTGYNKFLTKEGYPGIKPPWGTLNAIDLNSGEIVWRIPLGDNADFKKKGIITGTENYGGPVVTIGGVLFIAATSDGKFRAFNKTTGKLLWETSLPAPGFATPATYEVNGKQFVVIACGGGKLGTKSGDKYVAFALPD